jgi:predicted phage terminase large subunit-like protein
VAQYEGTTIGRQELHGELIDPEEAGIIKRSWIRMWKADRALPTFHYIVLSLDTAFTERTINHKTHDPDPTACTVWGLFNTEEVKIRHGVEDRKGKPGIMMLDAWDEQMAFPELLKRARAESLSRYGSNVSPVIKPKVGLPRLSSAGRRPDLIIIEDKGSGISLRQVLEREGLPTYKYNPLRADKLQRLHGISHYFANGFIWMIESDRKPGEFRDWTQKPLQQWCTYTGPGSIQHDDYVDSMTQAIRIITDKMVGGVIEPQYLGATPDHDPDSNETNVVSIRRASNPYAI